MSKLIMLSGLQGTGKSTLAKSLAQQLQIALFAKDHLETVLYNDQLTEGNSISSQYYEAWSPDDALFLDAINPLETNIEKALQYIRAFSYKMVYNEP